MRYFIMLMRVICFASYLAKAQQYGTTGQALDIFYFVHKFEPTLNKLKQTGHDDYTLKQHLLSISTGSGATDIALKAIISYYLQR